MRPVLIVLYPQGFDAVFVPRIDVAPFQQIEEVFFLRCVVGEDSIQFLGEPFGVAFQLVQVVGLAFIPGM